MSSPGWYLTHALHEHDSAYETYLADAFSAATRDRLMADLQERGIEIDLVVCKIISAAEATDRRQEKVFGLE